MVVFALGGGGWKVSLPAARSKNSTLLKKLKGGHRLVSFTVSICNIWVVKSSLSVTDLDKTRSRVGKSKSVTAGLLFGV